jgi:hypothetical protein
VGVFFGLFLGLLCGTGLLEYDCGVDAVSEEIGGLIWNVCVLMKMSGEGREEKRRWDESSSHVYICR